MKAILIVVLVVFGLVGCGGTSNDCATQIKQAEAKYHALGLYGAPDVTQIAACRGVK